MARITLPNGKRRAKYAKTQKEAKDWLLAQRQAVSKGLWVESEKATLGEYLDRWMADVVTHKLQPKTVNSYAYLIRLHIKPDLGHLKLTRLRPDQVQAMYAKKMAAGLSGRTVQYIHAVLHRSLEQAVKWGLVARNVTDAVDKPSPAKRLPKFLTAAQVKQLLVQLKDTGCLPCTSWRLPSARGRANCWALPMRIGRERCSPFASRCSFSPTRGW